MQKSLWNLTAAQLRDAAASGAPTPGGGSIAAVTATLGTALVQMALELTAKSSDAVALHGLKKQVVDQVRRLSPHADEDVRAFDSYVAATKLPRDTEDQTRIRNEALEAAAHTATEAPLASAREILGGLRLSQQAIEQCERQVASDVGAGAALMAGALTAILLTVDINLRNVHDERAHQRFREERDRLQAEGVRLCEDVIRAVSRRIDT